jgi:pimeloyl-ACP methyl ester carboxylesterase
VRKGRAALVAAGVAGGLAAGTATGYAVQRRMARRWRISADALVASGRTLPADLLHRFVPTDDGGRIHVVERGEGPPLVLVHGVTLGVATWAPQLRALAEGHRVIAIGQRGHGQSVAGDDGYSFERLAEDLREVLVDMDVTGCVLVGHSMGGMVAQTFAHRDPDGFAERVAGLVLLATTAGPFVPGNGGPALAAALTQGTGRGLRTAEARGRGLFPQDDVAAWATRACFGARPDPADLELTRSMISSMSPLAMAELLSPLLSFDLHRELVAIAVPTRVVVGNRDLLTPPRMARALAAGIPGAALTVYAGCGHMVMLERPGELNALLTSFSSAVTAAREG